MTAMKSTIPDNISEEYYQISLEILTSFPKYRPPLDLFQFNEDVAQLLPYVRKGNRLTNEQVEAVQQLCSEGNLFVSRADHPVYSKHIVKQLDLVLVDGNLKEGEIADITVKALQLRLEAFFEQPVKVVFEALYKDAMVFTEYLSQDRFRIKAFTRRLLTEHTLANHSVNTCIMGLWLYLKTQKDEYTRRKLDRITLGLLLHDIGMTKVPRFILDKPKPLTGDERGKVLQHVMEGAKHLHKLDLVFEEVQQMAMDHHERHDGSGYPRKLPGSQISSLGGLCAIADSFSAMISTRAHAPAMTAIEAVEALYKDVRRYNERLLGALHAAYLTKELQ